MITLKTNQVEKNSIINQAVKTLKNDGVIIYPTETCYGIGADATNQTAVNKVLDFKGFRNDKPISIAVSDINMANDYVEINPTAKNLYDKLLPGPLTVVSKSKGKVVSVLEAKTKTLGIRVPDCQIILNLIKKFNRPITSTSANISNSKTPYTIDDVLQKLSDKKKKLIDLIIDAGKLSKRPPSSVVDTTLNELEVLRKGEINFDQFKTKTKTTTSPTKTKKLGREITSQQSSVLENKCIFFALQGELGAGKTQFAKGIAQALGIRKTITSPTFTMIKEYQHDKGIFYHIDAWRINKQAFQQLNIDQYIQPGNVIAVEWVQKGKKLIEELRNNSQVKLILVDINHLDKTKRKIKYTS